MNVVKTLVRIWNCILWDHHDWTTAANQGKLFETINIQDLNSDNVVDRFNYSARMWCARCGTFSNLNEHPSTDPVPGCEPWIVDKKYPSSS